MDNKALRDLLLEGARKLDLEVSQSAADLLRRYAAELLRWNARVNLTAITDPEEVVEKHLLDSLAIAPEVAGARSLLDVGCGAGLPGLPMKVFSPELSVVLVDAVAKKIGFVKAVAAGLGLQGVTALHRRLEGHPEAEGVAPAEVVVSRAFANLETFVPLARAYAAPGGRIIAMLGKAPAPAPAASAAFQPASLRRYSLPFSGAERHVAVFHVEHPRT
ncbi:MAG TPA: 16S rRNA (guanine(527)-N(7))-methyltransferase RsmG [Myxococcales bacterium]|nr:16S rRNA (guanine(527)-N(7))-methyltransferase RsmG [Myxococcales bacterium]